MIRRFLGLLLALLLICPLALAEPWNDTAEELAHQLTGAGYPLQRLEAQDASKVTFLGGTLEVFATEADCEAAAAALEDDGVVAFRQENVLLIREPSRVTSHYEAALLALLTGEEVPEYDAQDVRKEQALETMVWVPTRGGKKYHARESCSNMIDPVSMTVREAISAGFDACKRCGPVTP